MALSADGGGAHFGAACTLNQIKESKLFPLLSLACGRIADHTNQVPDHPGRQPVRDHPLTGRRAFLFCSRMRI